MKRIMYVILTATLLTLPFALAAARAEAPGTRQFTDSLGRTVELPAQIERVAVTGSMAQMVTSALAPEKMVGLAEKIGKKEAPFYPAAYVGLPVLGRLYGGELNLETLLDSGAQVVIDVGEPKAGIAEDMDELSAQTGIPFVHITMHTYTMGDAYEVLGDLLGKPDEAAVLAAYCRETYAMIEDIASQAEKVFWN